MHRCSCGYTADRDVNAARNILKKAKGYIPERPGQLELNLA
ncbi:zinc ribbon domain-containing protein [Paenactinomyces guangxiensis]|uniref:Transposase n=1 Tax=Paenactinomyces guangxiensis TaxID=1490290 RepID=A0A7W2A7J7_9BACL|nr:transposase [Paenactinomyces guangxiensis]MBH8589961.1 transposase [Paenactinomyces guangxiensis]